MEDRTPRVYSYAMAIASLIAGKDKCSDKIFKEKLKALKRAWSFLELYSKEHFDERLLDAIMEKKAQLILNATSVKDIREIGEPQRPNYDGNKWIISPNSVPEEEMIWWSKASEKAPLMREAVERYMELFRQFYGDGIV